MAKLLRDTGHQEIERAGIQATKLYTHKEDVEATNLKELASLGGSSRKFLAQDSDPHMAKQMDTLCPVASCIELKVGAQVGLGSLVPRLSSPADFSPGLRDKIWAWKAWVRG